MSSSDAPGTAARLRAAGPGDAPVILPLVHAFYEHFGYPYVEEQKARAVQELIGDPALGVAWLVALGEEVVGYAILSFSFSLEFGGRTAFVDELFVVPERRGRGIGTAVLGLLEEEGRRLGLRALHLESEAANTGATALYTRLGFVDYHRRLLTKRLAP